MKEIDVRGFSCPIPVVKTKQDIEKNPGESLLVRLDSAVSRENVSRLARSMGYMIQEEGVEDRCQLILIPEE